MGTDIHIYVEQFDKEWREVPGPYTSTYDGQPSWCPWYQFHEHTERPDPVARDYEAFAFLADVRNDAMFGERIEPQFAGRGLPADTSYKTETETLGYHDQTHATLKELLAAPWDTTVKSCGFVDAEGFKEWRENGIPNGWCGDIGGAVRKHELEDFAALFDSGAITEHDYVRVYWDWQPLLDCPFHRWLKELAQRFPDTENIRVLMGFDS